MRLTVEIHLGNEAMQTASEASHAIQTALAGGGGLALFEPITEEFDRSIRDANGNTVGRLSITKEDS